MARKDPWFPASVEAYRVVTGRHRERNIRIFMTRATDSIADVARQEGLSESAVKAICADVRQQLEAGRDYYRTHGHYPDE